MTPAPRIVVLVVAATLVVTVIGMVSELAEGGQGPGVVAGALAAGVVAAVAVGWAHRAPVTVGVVVVLACGVYHLVGAPGLAAAVPMYPVIYLLTWSGRRWRLPLAAGLTVAVSAIPFLEPRPTPTTWGAVIGPAVLLLAVAAVGEAGRLRQVAAQETVRSVQATATEQERRRLLEERLAIAREVHDVVAHTLSVITVQSAAAVDALDTRPDDARTALVEVRRAARDATAELRGTLAVLRQDADPPADEAPAPMPGLDQLPDLVDRARAAGLTVTLDVIGTAGPRPPDLELAVHRIVQEALTNTLRHAGPTTASVVVVGGGGGGGGAGDGSIGDDLTVEIVDDGPADADPDAVPDRAPSPREGAHGLVGMRERARALGGHLEAGPTPAGGFRVAARLPARPSARLPDGPGLATPAAP